MPTRPRTRSRKWVLYVLGVVGLVVVISVAAYAIRWAIAPATGSLEAREQTQGDGTYRIAAYERFYDRCAAIQALEDQIATVNAAPVSKAQRDANALALTNQRARLIRAYNADAAKADTRAGFRSSDLPYRIDVSQERTTCAP